MSREQAREIACARAARYLKTSRLIMKKHSVPTKPLHLATTTVRSLDKKDLAPIVGGGGYSGFCRGIIIEG